MSHCAAAQVPPILSRPGVRAGVHVDKEGTTEMHSRLVGIGATAVAALVVAGGMVLPAAAANANGKIAFYANLNSTPNRAVFVGAVGDHGTVVNIDKDGKIDENGTFVKVTLTKGTFELDATALNKKLNRSTPPLAESENNCSAAFSASGPIKFFNGTGLYKGISGTATVTATFGGISPFYTSGAKKGQCNHNASQAPGASFGFVMGRGTVSFAS